MRRILITGATGNVGSEVIRYLFQANSSLSITAGVRNIDQSKMRFRDYSGLEFREFDFENPDTYKTAFSEIDTLFLLRPPHISEVKKYFEPLLKEAVHSKVSNIVFLSVQGVEKSKVIPHHRIERLIEQKKFDYIFVRPSYFMQNLTTTLLPEIQTKRQITLPSGRAKFNWVDIENIAEATAKLIIGFPKYKNQSYEITGSENRDFGEVVAMISTTTGLTIKYQNVNPIKFYFLKRREGVSRGLVMVMLLLHFLPRFQSAPLVSDNYRKLTGKKPTLLKQFLEREKKTLMHPGND